MLFLISRYIDFLSCVDHLVKCADAKTLQPRVSEISLLCMVHARTCVCRNELDKVKLNFFHTVNYHAILKCTD